MKMKNTAVKFYVVVAILTKNPRESAFSAG